eukprot:6383329-Alexandrium_andersonii.AAC.1
MSASLVGSEMCIRDSDKDLTTSNRPSAEHVSSMSHCFAQFRTVQPPTAVSYTHLTLPTICSV